MEVLKLPVSSLFRKLAFLRDREEREQNQQMQMWMVSQWAEIRAIRHVLIADKDVPPASKQEAEADTNWSKMARYKQFREEHDYEVEQALTSPKHFGAFIGMESVLGPPPPESVKTYEEAKAERQERLEAFADESKVYFLERSIFAKAAREGRGFAPAEEWKPDDEPS